jgi:hypothetical protein
MRRHYLLLIVIIPALAALVTLSLPSQVVAEKPLAILLSTSGDVNVTRASGETVSGEFGMPLSAGDIVQTGPNAGAEILLEDGTALQIGASSNMQIKEPAKKEAGTALGSFETVQNFLKLKNSEGTSSMSALRSGEKAADIRAESPCQTKIMDPHPTFEWSTDDPSTEVRITVYNEEGVQWKQDLSGSTQVTYPEDAPAMQSGISYSWTVESTDPLLFPPLRSQNAYFEVLSDTETQELTATLERVTEGKTPEEAPYHVIRASVFYDHGLINDAIRETTQAAELDQGNPALRTILARLYADIGRADDATSE